jgi:hypothetical protein
MTKLEALNIILDAIAVHPVTSYESTHPDAVRARQSLSRFNEEIQSRGWWFNQEPAISLSVTAVDNKILLPDGTLVVDPVCKTDLYAKRGNYLYDTANHTYEFDAAVVVNLVIELDFGDLPPSIQSYIARSAAIETAVVREGDQNKITRLETLLYSARSLAFSDEIRNGNYNIYNSSLPARVLSGIQPAIRRF